MTTSIAIAKSGLKTSIIESLYNEILTNSNNYYYFLGKTLPFGEDDTTETPAVTPAYEAAVRDEIIFMKKITSADVSFIIPRYNWVTNTVFDMYDDAISSTNPSTTGATSLETSKFYCMTPDYHVYKCLNNNDGAASTVQPYGSSYKLLELSDGYTWKYLFNVRASNKFLTDEWMPVPASTSKLDYDTSSLISVDGELAYLEVMNTGIGYTHSEISVLPFVSGTNTITVGNTNNIVANMSVSGTGIPGSTYITNVDTLNLKITISSNATANGGGSGNTVSVTTRIKLDGDGEAAIPVANVSNGGLTDITLTTYGYGYTRANVYVYGTGAGANVRAVLPPKFGHGYNSARELGATNVMVAMKIGEIDTTEGGLISSNTTFRQYGLLRDPYKYGDTTTISSSNANTVISQTTDLTIISGSYYNTDEFVFQGPSSSAATFSGFVNNQDANIVRLSKVTGSPSVGVPLKGVSTNPTGRAVVSIDNPEFEPYTGDILYVNNITKTQRTDGQAESIKFVVRF